MNQVSKATLDALKMYESDLEKLFYKVSDRRLKEIEKTNEKAKSLMGLDEDDLSNMWGYEQITWIEYQTKLKELSEFRENQQAFKDQPTKLSEYVRMLKRELNDVRIEIQELEEGLK